MKKGIAITSAAAIVGALLMMVALFLPFASATNDYKERLMSYPDSIYSEEANMKNRDVVHISLVEFIKIDSAAINMKISSSVATANMVVIIAFASFAALTLLFSILKKPIPVLIFDVISLAVIQLIKFDFEDRGVIPSSLYDWGAAHIICYIGIAVAAVGAVLLLILRIKDKRIAKVSG